MLFTEVIHAIHPHLMKDADVPEYMRTLIAMLCDVPEEEWTTKRDPSSEESYKDGSLRKFYTSGPSKKLAKKMLARLTKDNFLASIYSADRPDIVLDGIAEDIAPFTHTTSSDHVGENLFDLLKQGLEERINPELGNSRKIQQALQNSARLKGAYGSGLLEDCSNTCSIPGCTHHLQTLAADGQSADNYEILIINDKKPAGYPNICAVCHDCFQKYTLKHSATEKKRLADMKNFQMNARKARETLSETNIDKGILAVVESLNNPKFGNLCASINYEPIPLERKIDEKKYFILSQVVKMYVTKYFFPINQLMQNLSRQGKYSDELVRSQIKSAYLTLQNKGLSQIEIFENLSKQIFRITKQPEIYCKIVVSYFIQSCEVFHDITQ